MQRYFLHLSNGTGFTQDSDGADFPDLEAARQMAIRGIREVVAKDACEGMINLSTYVEIADANQATVAIVALDEAIELKSCISMRPGEQSDLQARHRY